MNRSSLAKVAGLLSLATFFNDPTVSTEIQHPVEIGLDRLKNQRSFRFEWRIQRPGVRGEFRGVYHYPDQIGMKGSWNFSEIKEKGEWVASGDEQFEWDPEKKEWQTLPRGEETDPLLQMFRILTGEFDWLREDRFKGRKTPVYGFLSSVPFLDPTMEKRLRGEIGLDPKTSLPNRVEIFEEGVSDSKLGWELLLFDYNEPFAIEIPTSRYQLVLEGNMKGVREVLEARMERGDFRDVEFQVERERMKVGFRTSGNPEKAVENLIAPGSLRIHLAQFPEEPVSNFVGASPLSRGFNPTRIPLPYEYQTKYGEGALLVFEREDVTKPLILQELLLTEKEVENVEVIFDELSRPFLRLLFTRVGVERITRGIQNRVNRPLAVLLDGRCLSSPIQRKPFSGRSFEIPGEFTLDEVEGMVLRLRAGPLSEGLKFISLKKL